MQEKCGLELVGEDLCKFHIDFSMDKSNSELYAVESLFLGKETYIDILESSDKDGNTISSKHIRMKGIPITNRTSPNCFIGICLLFVNSNNYFMYSILCRTT